METKFQTSFIPRRPLPATPGSLAPQVPKKHRDGASIFVAIGVIVFVLSLLSIGGAYLWKQYLLGAQKNYEASLVERQATFNIDQISLMKAQSIKISLAKQLLSNHLASSKIFSIISKLTSESTRFISMDLTIPVGIPAPFELTLVGYSRDYPSVAFQSDVLNQLEKYDLRAVVKNAIVSDPTLNRNGTVSFGFTAEIEPSSFLYSKKLNSVPGTDTNVPSPTPNQ
ncbi:MAG: hypothetical protein NT077_03040 [Candidatus Taylorbacteria bacterium]|nr:hypothetical protein [Candidatus Taylorbacteria bacterium]